MVTLLVPRNHSISTTSKDTAKVTSWQQTIIMTKTKIVTSWECVSEQKQKIFTPTNCQSLVWDTNLAALNFWNQNHNSVSKIDVANICTDVRGGVYTHFKISIQQLNHYYCKISAAIWMWLENSYLPPFSSIGGCFYTRLPFFKVNIL